MPRVFEQLLDPKISRILKAVLATPDEIFHLSKISHVSKVPMGTSFRIVNKLVRISILESIPVGKIRIYRLAKNEYVKELQKWL